MGLENDKNVDHIAAPNCVYGDEAQDGARERLTDFLSRPKVNSDERAINVRARELCWPPRSEVALCYYLTAMTSSKKV